MEQKSINEVLAANLREAMEARGWSQVRLAKESRVAQTTISLYLTPDRRKPGASGKVPSGKLSEVEAMAQALGLAYWELLMPMNEDQRQLLRQFGQLVQKASGGGSTKVPEAPTGNRMAA